MKKILFLICLITIFLSIIPDIYRLRQTPPNTVFPLIHNHPEDYFYYLSFMRQGYDGQILLTSRLTSEKFEPKLVYTFFAILGHFSRITHISIPFTYFISRILLGIILLIVSVFIGSKIFKANYNRLLLTIFLCFSTGFWTYQSGRITQYLNFWTRFDPIIRTTYLPHHLFSSIFGILSLYYFARGLEKNDIKYLVIAGLSGMISGFVFYSTMINIIGGVVLIMIVMNIKLIMTNFQRNSRSESLTKTFRINKLFLIYITISSLSLIYLFLLSKSTFPWNTYQNLSQEFTFDTPLMQYIAALGPSFILTLIGIPLIIKSKNTLSFIMLGWILFPFIGLYLLNQIFPSLSNMIYLEATSYIPTSILAVYGIRYLYKLFPTRRIITLISLFIIIYFIPPLVSSFSKALTILPNNYYNIYIPNAVIESFNWLNKYTPKESVVLAGGYFGNIIPAYTSNRVFYGHRIDTFDAKEKLKLAYQIFSGQDAILAKKLSQQYNLSYIYYSLDTDLPTDKFLQNIDLKLVYQNAKVRIYKF